jgi:hypothetical protein
VHECTVFCAFSLAYNPLAGKAEGSPSITHSVSNYRILYQKIL